jgi:CspA family cold shock protein
MPHGTVRWFDAERGFGFLAPEDGSPDVFVHASEIVGDGGPKVLREGQAVEFEAGENDRGPQALRVRVTADAAAGSAVGLLGTVNWYEPAKGYGFASPDGGGPDIFVHSSAIVTGGVVTDGQRVAFVVVEGERGPQAAHVVPLGPGAGLSTGAGGADGADGADGTVSWYDEDKGFGFIAPDSGAGDVFVHARSLAEGLTWLAEGDRVAYEVVSGDKGPHVPARAWSHGTTGTAGSGSSPRTPAVTTCSCTCPWWPDRSRCSRATVSGTPCVRATGARRPTAWSASEALPLPLDGARGHARDVEHDPIHARHLVGDAR